MNIFNDFETLQLINLDEVEWDATTPYVNWKYRHVGMTGGMTEVIVKPDSTDITTYFVLRSLSSGEELTGAVITDIDLIYTRSGSDHTVKVDATALAAPDSAHADNKAIEVDATFAPGLYRVDWPDAAFAAGVKRVILTVQYPGVSFTEHLRVELGPSVDIASVLDALAAATNLKAMFDGTGYAGGTIRLKTDVDTVKTQAVTCGAPITIGPYVGNANAAISVDANGRLDISKISGTAQTARDIGASVLLSSGTGTGEVNLSAGAVALQSGQKVDVDTIKTRSVTCGAPVTVLAYVGTAASSTAQSGDAYSIVTNGTYGNAAIMTALGSAGLGPATFQWNPSWSLEVEDAVRQVLRGLPGIMKKME